MTFSPLSRPLPFVAAGLLVVAGCGGGSDQAAQSATPSATASSVAPVKESPACSFVTSAERTRLAGVPIDTVVSADARTGSSQCRWQESNALIQLTTLPAAMWATSLPEVMAQLEASSDLKSAADKRDLAKAKKLLAGADSFTDAQACKAFVTLAELGGSAKGSRITITSVPITETESGISAQTCSGGALTSIIYSVPGLKQTAKVDKTVTQILTRAHQRVLAAG